MTVTITAFERAPDRGRGLARDMRVRWALEEVGQPYAVRLVSFEALKAPPHLALQPFGQIPTYEEDGLVLFESGAIVLHIAERRGALLGGDAQARARAIGWMFAAVDTVEPPIVEYGASAREGAGEDWWEVRRPVLEARVRQRLDPLSARLSDAEWLDGAFSVGDLMMVTVLRRAAVAGFIADYPNLAAYVARAQARPAYQRAFADQLAVFNNGSATPMTR